MTEKQRGVLGFYKAGRPAGITVVKDGLDDKTNFVDMFDKEVDDNYNFSITENGALGYRTTGSNLLDISFKLSSYRNRSECEIIADFQKAYHSDKVSALHFLFFARDIRGGAGERRYFRVVLKYLAGNDPMVAKALIPIIPHYGRWDDLFSMYFQDKDVDKALDIAISGRLAKDYNIVEGKKDESISLLAKWMPSVGKARTNIHLQDVRLHFVNTMFEGDWAVYQGFLKLLRRRLDVVECKMSEKRWKEIDYNAVPASAGMKYSSAFLRNDEERRRKYLEDLTKGVGKINAGTLFPHEIVARVRAQNRYDRGRRSVSTPEIIQMNETWKALPRPENIGNVFVVQDGSGSMYQTIGATRSDVRAIDVSMALAIYFAELATGVFKDKYVTFSSRPKLMTVPQGEGIGIYDKVKYALTNTDCSNTNIEAVFDMVLSTAVKNHLRQEDLPETIMVISDMEFDYTIGRSGDVERLFETIERKYAAHGYKLPKLAFWNVCGRTDTIPVKENENGVILMSGFSPASIKMVLSGKLDPLEALIDTIFSDRYKLVGQALMTLIPKD